MGYYTNYNFIVETEDIRREAEEEFKVDLTGSSPHKWYDHEEDMIAFSKKYPDTLVTLYGEGENPGDLWVKYFKNGQAQVEPTKIVYPECKL